MDTSFMYHAYGVKDYTCTATQYEGNNIIFKMQTAKRKHCCCRCGSRQVILFGKSKRRLRTVPIGLKQVYIELHLHRLQCKNCNSIGLEPIRIVQGKRSYTRKFERYVLALSKAMTIKDLSALLGVSWDTVKDIQKRYLKRKFSRPDLSKVRYIGIDEFAVRKGHRYMTIVVDLERGEVLHIGDGKGMDALLEFWKRVNKEKVSIQAIATDLSTAFIASVMENAPGVPLVFDHFHVVKLMNTALDKLRRDVYNQEKDLHKRKVTKGLRWVLLQNSEKTKDNADAKKRLDQALAVNHDLAQAYYLKEELREIWRQANKREAEEKLLDWVLKARSTTIEVLKKMAATLLAHKFGILAWYDYHISTGKIEGINNKIKTMKRQAYGYRDEVFFKLSVLAIHTKTYAFVG